MEQFDLTQYGGFRMQVLQTLAAANGAPMSNTDILGALRIPDTRLARNNLHHILLRARKAGEVERVQRGRYIYSGPPLS